MNWHEVKGAVVRVWWADIVILLYNVHMILYILQVGYGYCQSHNPPGFKFDSTKGQWVPTVSLAGKLPPEFKRMVSLRKEFDNARLVRHRVAACFACCLINGPLRSYASVRCGEKSSSETY
jgi:hypothetical protein